MSRTPHTMEEPMEALGGNGLLRAQDDMGARIAARLFASESVVRIGRFEVERYLGAGGMGAVYVARDPSLSRHVALKILHAGLVYESGASEHERLLREAHALARLSHPNVVQIHEVGSHEGRVFIAMEYVDGQSLREWQAAADRSWREIIGVYCQAAAGLVAAHAVGLVHRDFKPSNVLVGSDGRVRVADFGLARAKDAPAASGLPATSPSSTSLGELLTRSGTVLGTPAYMAPEQLAGMEVGPAADQWSFCVAIWEALHGVRPFEPADLLGGDDTTTPRTGRPRGPRAVRTVLSRGLARQPALRWSSMEELRGRLVALATPDRRAKTILAVAGLCIAGIAALRTSDGDPCPPPLDDIAPVWDASRRRVTEEALGRLAPMVSSSAVARVLDDLDRFRLQWLQSQVDGCRAGRVDDPGARGQWEARQSCLDLALVRFRTIVPLLTDSDLSTFAAADAMIDALGDPRRCLDVGGNAPNPGEEGVLARLEAAEVELARGGRLSDETGELVSASADSPGASARQSATALSLRGRMRLLAGDAVGGTRDLLDAVNTAEAGRLDRIAAQTWLHLVVAATNHLVATERAEGWLERARAAVDRVGAPPDLSLKVERAAALVARERGDWSAARAHIERALSYPNLPSTLSGQLRLELADVDANTGSPGAAAAAMTQVLERWTEELGTSHPLVADAHIHLGRLTRRADPQAAAVHFEAAMRLRASAYGESSPRLATPLIGLAEALLQQEDLGGAKAHAARAVELQRRLPKGHVERGGALAILGAIAQMESSHEESAAAFTELAEEWSVGPRAAQRPLALNNAAWSLLQLGRAGQARALYASLRAETPQDDALHVVALAGLGRADHLLGEHEAARVELEAAHGVAAELDRAPDANPELLPEISWHLAETLDVLGREPQRRCELVRAASARYDRWPERIEARAALARLITRCTTTKETKP